MDEKADLCAVGKSMKIEVYIIHLHPFACLGAHTADFWNFDFNR